MTFMIADIATAVGMNAHEADSTLERLFAKNLVFRSAIDGPGDFVYWLRDFDVIGRRTSEAKTNIHLVGTMQVNSTISQGKMYAMPIPGEKPYAALLMCFRNEARKESAPKQPDVKAHIVYKDSADRELADLNSGVWIEEYNDYTRFSSGDKKCLVILAMYLPEKRLRKVWKEEYHTQDSWMGGSMFVIREEHVPWPIATITVELLDRSDGSFIDEFTVRVSGGLATVFPALSS